MAQPKWLRGSRKSWERIGFLKLAAILSPQASSGSDFVQKMRGRINSLVRVPYSSVYADWLATNGLLKSPRSAGTSPGTDIIESNLQHWWIFNTATQTGWLSRDGIPEYFEFFPRRIGMLEQDFSPSELGRTLTLGLISGDEAEKWGGETLSAESPLLLTRSQKVYFIYAILRVDGDFLLLLLEQLADKFGNSKFSYLDAGQLIPPALDAMASYFRSSAYTDDDQQALREIDRVRGVIEKQIENKVEELGSGSRREQTSIPRLGWLLDIGILEREGPRAYKFTKQGLSLVKELSSSYRSLLSQHYPEDCLSKLLDRHLFGPVIEFICGDAKKAGQADCLSLLKEAYEVVKGPLGYVLIRSLVLLANGRQAERGAPTFIEYDDAFEVVRSEYRTNPKDVYYTVDRLGDEHQVKFAI